MAMPKAQRILSLLFILSLAFPFSSHAAPSKKPLLFAFYHPWYGTPWGPAKQWHKWDSFRFPDRYNPERIEAGGQRDIASVDYPLIGAYDNSDPEIVRWHFRLAKAAGIDRFLCSWWKFPRQSTWGDWQSGLFESVLLPIAQEENFKIGVIDECAHYVKNHDHLLNRITNNLPRLAQHPGYLKIDGQPVWFIYQVWDDWLSAEQAEQYVTAAEKQVGDVFWIFDKLKTVATSTRVAAHMSVRPEWLDIEKIDCFGTYSYFGHWRDVRPATIKKLFAGYAKEVRKAGKKVQLPFSPAHDNTPVNPEPFLCPGKDGATLKDFLRAIDQAKPDVAVVCSFNEWLEGTQVEPSRNWKDPYCYLKWIAEWRGKKWTTPELPSKTSLDPQQ